jgi:hypothetical protein
MNTTQYLRICRAAYKQMAAEKSMILKPAYLESACLAEGLPRQQVAADAFYLLKMTAESLNAEEIESLLTLAGELIATQEGIDVLTRLLSLPNHTRHEDIIGLLQHLKEPRTVDALYTAALVKHDYLAYDDSFGLARKCTWALADIGTPEAISRLRTLAEHSNAQIAEYAKKRLDRWDDELTRKRA